MFKYIIYFTRFSGAPSALSVKYDNGRIVPLKELHSSSRKTQLYIHRLKCNINIQKILLMENHIQRTKQR